MEEIESSVKDVVELNHPKDCPVKKNLIVAKVCSIMSRFISKGIDITTEQAYYIYKTKKENKNVR